MFYSHQKPIDALNKRAQIRDLDLIVVSLEAHWRSHFRNRFKRPFQSDLKYVASGYWLAQDVFYDCELPHVKQVVRDSHGQACGVKEYNPLSPPAGTSNKEVALRVRELASRQP